MKKILTLFIVLFTLNWAIAQPELTFEKHGLQTGIAMETVNVEGNIDVSISGENVVWDFSNLNLNYNKNGVEKVINVDPQGNVSVMGKSDALFSFKCTPNGNFWTGYSNTCYDLIFDKPVQKVKYPFQYGTTIEGFAHANITAAVDQSPTNQSIEGNYSSTVDGYGTIILPNGVKIDNVLRVKTFFNYGYIHTGTQMFRISEIKYLWYAQEFRCPVFVALSQNIEHASESFEGFLNTETNGFVQDKPEVPMVKLTTAQVTEKPLTYTIYPNPTNGDLQLSYKLDKAAHIKIDLFTSYGQKVGELVNQYQIEGSYTVNYKLHMIGNYMLSISADNYNVVEQIVRK